MPGIYGNHPEDRYFSRLLNDHLEDEDVDESEKAIERAEYLRQQAKDKALEDSWNADENLGDC